VSSLDMRSARVPVVTNLALITCIILSPHALAGAPNEALELIESARASICSYDIRVNCTKRLLLRQLERESIDAGGGRKITVPRFDVLTWDEAQVRERSYRQVMRDQGKHPLPLRAVQEFSLKSTATLSVLAFDGTVRRSLYNDTRQALVAAPPEGQHQFVEYTLDYFNVVGLRVLGKYELLSDLVTVHGILADSCHERARGLRRQRPQPHEIPS
jgi:hypothetical protein